MTMFALMTHGILLVSILVVMDCGPSPLHKLLLLVLVIVGHLLSYWHGSNVSARTIAKTLGITLPP